MSEITPGNVLLINASNGKQEDVVVLSISGNYFLCVDQLNLTGLVGRSIIVENKGNQGNLYYAEFFRKKIDDDKKKFNEMHSKLAKEVSNHEECLGRAERKIKKLEDMTYVSAKQRAKAVSYDIMMKDSKYLIKALRAEGEL